MSIYSRRAAIGLLGGVALASVAGCSKEDKPGTTAVNVGYIADFNGASLIAIAAAQGLWAKHGLDPKLSVFTNGPLQITALGTGDLDVGYVGPGALWMPAKGQAKVIAVNSLGFADRVIAQPGIATVADLKGKKVGVPEGTSGDMILRLALEKAGLSIKDVQKVAMDASTVVTAFSSGQIDAAGIWYPLIDTIKGKVPTLGELAKNEDFYPETSFPSAFVARNDSSTELLSKVVKVLKEANDYRASHVDESVTLTAAFLKVPAEKLKVEAANVRFLTAAELTAKTKDGTVAGWFRSINKQFVAFGRLAADVDPAQYYRADLWS